MTNDQSPYAIRPPRVPAGIEPVISDPEPPADIPIVGLPQSIFRPVSRQDGTQEGATLVEVNPPSRDPIDYVAIELCIQRLTPNPSEVVRVERKAVPEADRNKIIPFELFQSLLGTSGVYAVFYKVERSFGNPEPSTHLWAMYSRDLPGGNEPPGTGDHPNLNISLPEEFGEPPHIGFEDVDTGVPVTVDYPHCNPYDVITLELNRERFPFTVQPGEAGRPYVITVTQDMFERAGITTDCSISYTVVSQLNNPTHNRRWSKTIKATVDMANHLAPDLIDDPQNPGGTPGKIDKDVMKGGPLYVHYDGKDDHWRINDHIIVKYTSTLDGSVVPVEVRREVTEVPFTHSVEIPNDKVILGSTVKVFYQHWRGTTHLDDSPPVEEPVVGTAVPEMAKPDLIEDLSIPHDTPGTIELSKLLPDGLHFLVHLEADHDWQRLDYVRITYEYSLNGKVDKYSEDRQLLTTPIPSLLAFKVPVVHVKLDSTVRAFYQQVRGGQVIATSLVAEAVVVEGEVIDIRPIIKLIKDSKGAEIKDGGTTSDSNITIEGEASPRLSVQLYDGSTPKPPITSVDTNGFWTKNINGLSPTTHLIKAKALYGKQWESEIITFTVSNAILSENFDNLPDSANTRLDIPSMSVRASVAGSSGIRIGDTVETFPGKIEGKTLWTYFYGDYEITFTATYTEVSFWCILRSEAAKNTTYFFYNSKDEIVDQQTPSVVGVNQIKSSAGQIKKIKWHLHDTSFKRVDYDNFSFLV